MGLQAEAGQKRVLLQPALVGAGEALRQTQPEAPSPPLQTQTQALRLLKDPVDGVPVGKGGGDGPGFRVLGIRQGGQGSDGLVIAFSRARRQDQRADGQQQDQRKGDRSFSHVGFLSVKTPVGAGDSRPRRAL